MTKKEREAHEERPTAHFISYINPNYSPFDNSPEYITKCSNCGCGLYDTAYYCPICGVKINERVVRSRNNGKIEYSPWIPVSERLPLCEQEVLICTQRRSIGGKTKSIITSAVYEDGNMRECNSRWHWEDIEYESWDEEEDCGIIPEGWWEYRHYNPDEVYNNLVDDFILAWMPLPKPYKTESEE